MTIDTKLILRRTIAQSTQNVFWSINLREYFNVLEEMLGKESMRLEKELTARFSDFDDEYTCSFKRDKKTVLHNVTIGDLAYAITEMLLVTSYTPVKSSSYGMMIHRTGINLFESLIMRPFIRLMEKYPEYLVRYKQD